MKIEIVTKNVDNDSMVREFIQRKVHFALDRFDARIEKVVVNLKDETKNSHAFDGLCQIDAYMSPSGQLHVSAHGDSAFDSVLQATRKIENAIKHDIDRNRNSSRIRHQQSKRKFIEELDQEAQAALDGVEASSENSISEPVDGTQQ